MSTDPIQALRDKKAQHLDVIDDILRTAEQNGQRRLPADEQAQHDAAVAAVAVIDDVLRTAGNGDAQRSNGARYSAPNINVRGHGSVGAGDESLRNLDACLWATDETVRAGTLDQQGQLHTSGALNPVDQVVIRSDIGDAGVLAPRINEYGPEGRDAVRNFQKTVADMCFFGMMVDGTAKTSGQGFQVARNHRLFRDRWNHVLRAMDVDTTAEGIEWVPTGIGANMHEKVRAAGKVVPLFQRINLPSNPWKMPVEGADLSVYRVAEPTSDAASKVTASTPGTAAVTFDAEILGARSIWSRSLDADSAVVMVPFYQRKLIRAYVDAEERSVLDGDTDGTHQDSDVGASTTDPRTSWDGLRKKGIAQTSRAITTTTAANLALVRKDMGLWGANPDDLAYIIGLSSYHVLLSDSSLLTVDKMGPQATILNGQIGSLYGIPVIVSQWVREDLNASGAYDGITTTKTYALCVNRQEWVVGSRMALDVAVDDSIYRETFQRVIVAFERVDVQSVAAAAADDDTSYGYNITSGS